MRYLYWAGTEKGFAPKPVALSFISPSQPRATSPTARDSPPPARPSFAPVNRKRSNPSDSPESSGSSGSSGSSDTSDSEVEERSSPMPDLAHPGADAGPEEFVQQIDASTSVRRDHLTSETNPLKQSAAFQSGPSKRRKTEVSSREMDQLYSVSPPARRRSDAQLPSRVHQAGPAQPTTTTSTSTKLVSDREEKRKQSAIARIEKSLERKFDQIFTPWAGEDQSVSRNTLVTILKVIRLMKDSSPQKISRELNKAVNGGDGKRQDAGGSKPMKPPIEALEATLMAGNSVTVNGSTRDPPSSPAGLNRQQLDQRPLHRAEAANVQGTGSDPRSNPLDPNQHPLVWDLILSSSPSMLLTEHKQKQTTLYVRVANSLEYLPLKMSECMTPGAFYTKVLSAWDIREESVAKITATFTWMDPTNRMRTMIMNSRVQSCFEHLMGQIDEAPSWEESGKGKCVLDVDIILKE